MSIQPGRVVARIVDEVANSARPSLATARFEVDAFLDRAEGCVFEVVRVDAESSPRFATLFHFWTHALRGFLERGGEGDQLEGLAGYAMCQAIPVEVWRDSLASQLARLAAPARRDPELAGLAAALRSRASSFESYRMIDGPCRRSQVAATDDGWIAWFWAHGHRTPARIALETRT